jgi:CDP-paratose 2-epimerase
LAAVNSWFKLLAKTNIILARFVRLMKILITGICGFTGSTLARFFQQCDSTVELYGIDNLGRAGSEQNSPRLKAVGIRLFHGDVRCASDLDSLPHVQWVIDAAANPSVLAGVSGNSTSRQVLEHNLIGTVNVLEYCKRSGAGLILLSTSRVYSINQLVSLPLTIRNKAYRPRFEASSVVGLSSEGVAENFSTMPPISLYGSTKLASELLALEYGEAFGLPIWINRCGVLAGAGQFGQADQGIFTFWINSYLRQKPLSYIGFDGRGYQVRDCLHPRDVATLVWKQMQSPDQRAERVQNVAGGVNSAISLAQLSDWCAERFGKHDIGQEPISRSYDVPWIVLDSTLAGRQWNWEPALSLQQILEEIAQHAEAHPEWLEISSRT